jgi:hypothetical protein
MDIYIEKKRLVKSTIKKIGKYFIQQDSFNLLSKSLKISSLILYFINNININEINKVKYKNKKLLNFFISSVIMNNRFFNLT